MFLESGAKVTMQDRPDLKIEWLGVVFYAEVKHFNRKEPDQHDEAAMRSARNELAMDGDIRKSEGRSSYEQMSDVARKKTPQYVDGAINILVIDSSSDCMDYVDEMALSGMREYNEELRKTPNDVALRRLHGIMLISDWGSVGPNSRNVGFAMAWKASPPHMRGSCMRHFEASAEDE